MDEEKTCHIKYDNAHRDYVCDNCGTFFDTPEYLTIYQDSFLKWNAFKYCPECGAYVIEYEE